MSLSDRCRRTSIRASVFAIAVTALTLAAAVAGASSRVDRAEGISDVVGADVALALESARELGVEMPLTEAGGELYRRSVEQGRAEQVFFATLATLERAAGAEVEKL